MKEVQWSKSKGKDKIEVLRGEEYNKTNNKYIIDQQREKRIVERNISRYIGQNRIIISERFLFNKIAFSSDETWVERNAYGITEQLYDAFTRGQ